MENVVKGTWNADFMRLAYHAFNCQLIVLIITSPTLLQYARHMCPCCRDPLLPKETGPHMLVQGEHDGKLVFLAHWGWSSF